MPLPAILEAFLVDDREPLAERVEHGRRGGVVVAVAGVVAVEQLEVEVPGVDDRLAGAQALQRARSNRNRREAGRTPEALLRAAIGDVDAILVEEDRHR